MYKSGPDDDKDMHEEIKSLTDSVNQLSQRVDALTLYVFGGFKDGKPVTAFVAKVARINTWLSIIAAGAVTGGTADLINFLVNHFGSGIKTVPH